MASGSASGAPLACLGGALVAGALVAYGLISRKAARDAEPVVKSGPKTFVFPAEELHRFTKEVFMHFGVPEEDAQVAAEVLAASDLRGIDSHGVARLHTYFELLQEHRINPRPNVRSSPTRRLREAGARQGPRGQAARGRHRRT